MIVHKCDRCEKELKNFLIINKVTISEFFSIDYELCDNCTKELKSFLRVDNIENINNKK